MLNQVATEAFYSATYVDNYIDSVENLPDDVQRYLTRIRDIDVQYRGLLREVDHYYDLMRTFQYSNDQQKKKKIISRMQQSLIQAQELGDEKMQTVNQLQELIDQKTRQLDTDQRNLDIKEELIVKEDLDDICGAPPPPKRVQSPARVTEISNGSVAVQSIIGNVGNNSSSVGNLGVVKDHSVYSVYAGGLVPSGGGNGGGSTPTSERSGNISNGATVGSSSNSGNGANTSNLGNIELQRVSSKRSRRRIESVINSGNMELGGNESNSANEAGSNGDRKPGGVGNGLKKSASQHQAVGSSSGNVAAAAGSGVGSSASGNSAGKKKKRKVRGAQTSSAQSNAREETPPPDPIDPDEPTYCVCNQISFGEMILCDNDLCPIEWFHFSCVSLVLKPKGKWYCPNCRGDRQNVMKPKAQFLKELERYNKEKEEKT